MDNKINLTESNKSDSIGDNTIKQKWNQPTITLITNEQDIDGKISSTKETTGNAFGPS